MIWALLAATGVAAGAMALCIRFWRRLRAERRQHRADVDELQRQLKERVELIRRMEEANETARKRKDSLHTGSDAERFDAGKRILSDIAGGGGRAGNDSD